MDRKVFICSPWRTDCPETRARFRAIAAALARVAMVRYGLIPIAPHLFYGSILDDSVDEERRIGLRAGLALLEACDVIWIYSCQGHATPGMRAEIAAAKRLGIEARRFMSEVELQVFIEFGGADKYAEAIFGALEGEEGDGDE